MVNIIKTLDFKWQSDYIYFLIGGVAQLAEQRNHNPRVRGSSPCTATKGEKMQSTPKTFQKAERFFS